MKRTHARTLFGLALVGAAVGFLVQFLLAAESFPRLRPEYTLAISLVLIAAIVIALAVPVRRATHGTARRRIDPFYATRVVVLAKASSLGGAILTGFGLGMLLELTVRAGQPPTDTLLRLGAMIGASVLVLIAGLVAEHLCTVPPEDDKTDPPAHGAAG